MFYLNFLQKKPSFTSTVIFVQFCLIILTMGTKRTFWAFDTSKFSFYWKPKRISCAIINGRSAWIEIFLPSIWIKRYHKYLTSLTFLGPYCKLWILVFPPRFVLGPYIQAEKNSVRILQYGPRTRLVRGTSDGKLVLMNRFETWESLDSPKLKLTSTLRSSTILVH